LAEYHPDRNALERFARAEIAETELTLLVNHLRSGCPICQPTVDVLLPHLDELPAYDVLGLHGGPGASGPHHSPGSHHSHASDTARESAQALQGANETDSTDFTRCQQRPAGRIFGPPASAVSSRARSQPPRFRGQLAPLPLQVKGGTAPYPAPAGAAGATGTNRRARREPYRQAALTAGAPGGWASDRCRERAGIPYDPLEDKDLENEAWDRMFAKVEQRFVQVVAERAAAPRLLAELLRRPAAERSALVCTHRHLQSLVLCDLLLDRSFEAGCHDSAEATALAQLGIQIADQLDILIYGTAVVHDMKARAWACLGNSRRLGADFTGAEQALAFAEALFEDGSADPLEEARLLDLKALLLSDQGWFEEAAELLDTVVEIYDDVEDPHRKGRALIAKGICLGRAGWPQLAVDLILSGLALLDRKLEPRLALTARQELAWFLVECGRSDNAQRQLDRVRADLLGDEDPRAELRMEWLEARIAHLSGRWPEAELSLGRLLQRFVSGGNGYEVAMVMLDMARLHLDQGKRSEIRRLAEDVVPVVLSLDIHRQAAAALVTFQQAAQGDQVTPALVGDIAAYLQRARKNPRLSFQLAA